MKVQLVRPPVDDWYKVGQLKDNTSYPVGLSLLAKTLRQQVPGVEVEVIDGHKKPLEVTLSKVGNADFVGVTSIYSNYAGALRILAHAKSRGAKTIIGGANVTHLADRILINHDYVDFAVVNDGEEALPEIVSGAAGRTTPNLTYRDMAGSIIRSNVNQNAPLTTTFDLEDITERESWKPKSIPVSGIRGCMKAATNDLCDFCSIDHRLKVMDPKIMWEQARILKGYGFDYLWEVGETVFPAYLNNLLKTRPNDLKDTKWKFYICADLVTPDVARTLKELGTREVQMGIETPNDNILEKIGKKSRKADVDRAVELISANDINIHAAIMYGLTGETPESAKNTFDFIKRLAQNYPNIKKITTSHAVPFVGTKMFRRLAENPAVTSQYPGDLNHDDQFDYHNLTRLYVEHFTTVQFNEMEKLVRETRALMNGRGYGTSFDLNPENKDKTC